MKSTINTVLVSALFPLFALLVGADAQAGTVTVSITGPTTAKATISGYPAENGPYTAEFFQTDDDSTSPIPGDEGTYEDGGGVEVQNGEASDAWVDPQTNTIESGDVITVKVYDKDGNQVGTGSVEKKTLVDRVIEVITLGKLFGIFGKQDRTQIQGLPETVPIDWRKEASVC